MYAESANNLLNISKRRICVAPKSSHCFSHQSTDAVNKNGVKIPEEVW